MGAKGATVAWARRVARLMDLSLKELYEYLQGRSDLNDVAAIRAVMLLRSSDQAAQFERLASRFGFEPVPEPDTLGRRLRRVGQNVVGLLLILASNPRAAHLDFLLRSGAPFFISRRRLEERISGAGRSSRPRTGSHDAWARRRTSQPGSAARARSPRRSASSTLPWLRF